MLVRSVVRQVLIVYVLNERAVTIRKIAENPINSTVFMAVLRTITLNVLKLWDEGFACNGVWIEIFNTRTFRLQLKENLWPRSKNDLGMNGNKF